MPIPLKVLPEVGDTNTLAEFTPTDLIPVQNLPDAATQGFATAADLVNHLNDIANPHAVTAAQVGAIPVAEKGVANGVAPLNALNEIPLIHIPSAAIPEVDVVADAAARLALIPLRQEGDSLFQTDDSTTWKHDGATYVLWSPQEIFGSQFQSVESAAVTTTFSTGFITKGILTIPVIPAGDYYIGWNYQWNHDSNGNDFEGVVILDNVIFANHKQEPKDNAGNFSGTGSAQRYQTSGFAIRTLTNAAHQVRFAFRTDTGSSESSAWDVRIIIYRVA